MAIPAALAGTSIGGTMRHPEMDFNFNMPRWAPVAAVVFLLILLGFSSYHIVPPGHRGISITLGKVSPAARDEGINFKKPFVENLINFPIRQRTEEGRASAYSSDLQ